MHEYKIILIGNQSPPAIEEKLNKLALQNWVVNGSLQFNCGQALLIERLVIAPEPQEVPATEFQETLNRLAGRQ